MSLALAASTALVSSIIAAVASLVSAALVALVTWRAQRAEEQLQEIRQIVDEAGERTATVVKEAIRDVLGTHPSKRRWYE